MPRVGKICTKSASPNSQATTGDITGGICQPCCLRLSATANHSEGLEAIAAPVLLMQGRPRQVVTAN